MNLFDLLANFWRVDEQKNFYGGMIGDRLRMMFNFITMKGVSRRC
jgi:hypothetical protein